MAAQDRAAKGAVRYHQLFVSSMPEIVQHDGLGSIRAQKVARRKHADARNLQISGNDAALIRSHPAREMLRQDARLLVGRFDQAVTDAAMFGAFAEREDVRRAGREMIVDDDAAIDG